MKFHNNHIYRGSFNYLSGFHGNAFASVIPLFLYEYYEEYSAMKNIWNAVSILIAITVQVLL